MIKEIQTTGFTYPLVNATVSLNEMGERTITAQVKVDGGTKVPSTEGWELTFRGERYILPVRNPQAEKGNESVDSLVDFTFHHWAIHEMKRYYFMDMVSTDAGTAVADKYVAPIALNIENFVLLFNKVLNHYFNGSIQMELYDGQSYPVEPAFFDISYSYIWEVLQKMYDIYKTRWYIDYNSSNGVYYIRVNYPTQDVSHTFKYGFDGGLMKVQRQNQNDDIRNILLGRGGEKNIPFLYFKNYELFHPHNPNYSNHGFTPDPDAIPELENVTFTNLRGATFRAYVQGWKTNLMRQLSTSDGWHGERDTYDAYRGDTDFYYYKGAHDLKFNPTEYVKDDDSIAKYGELWGALDNNEEIYPSIQGRSRSGLGRIDQVIAVEEVKVDNPQSEGEAYVGSYAALPDISTKGDMRPTSSVTKTLTIGSFTVEPSYKGSIEGFAEVKADRGYYGWNDDSELVKEKLALLDSILHITSYSFHVYEESTDSEVSSIYNIPSGTYTLKLTVTFTSSEYNYQLHYTVSSSGVKLTTVRVDGSIGDFKPTFDIWVKNLWGTTFRDSQHRYESEDDYVERVWRSILGDKTGGEAKVVFSSGLLSISSDYEFVMNGPNIFNAVHYDTSKSLGGVSSEWRLTLQKSDSEYEATGLYLPNTKINAIAGNTFFFTGIDVPYEYVYLAEEELDNTKMLQLNTLKDIMPTWVVTLDKVRMQSYEGGTKLIDTIDAGKVVTLNEPRLMSESLSLHIQSVTMRWENGVMIPDMEVVLADQVAVVMSTVQRIQSDVNVLKAQYVELSNLEQTIRDIADSLYLKKTGEEDMSLSQTAFASVLRSSNFRQGTVGGTGWGIYEDSNKMKVLEADKLILRESLSVNSLVINQTQHEGGMTVQSAASMTCSFVESTSVNGIAAFACYFDQRRGTVANTFAVGDIAYAQRWDAEWGETIYYKRRILEVLDNCIKIQAQGEATEVYGTIVDGKVIEPRVDDVIIQYGSSSEERQFAIVQDVVGGGYQRMIWGLENADSSGVEYYFAGAHKNDGTLTPRWFVGDNTNYAQYVNGTLTIRGNILLEDGTEVQDTSYLIQSLGDDGAQGLLLATQIAVYNGENIMGGISGVAASPTDIAAWFGGAKQEGNATTLFRFDGTGYVAGGNLSWDDDGRVTLNSANIDITQSMNLQELINTVMSLGSWFGEDEDHSVYVKPYGTTPRDFKNDGNIIGKKGVAAGGITDPTSHGGGTGGTAYTLRGDIAENTLRMTLTSDDEMFPSSEVSLLADGLAEFVKSGNTLKLSVTDAKVWGAVGGHLLGEDNKILPILLPSIVSLDTAQTITGQKTFNTDNNSKPVLLSRLGLGNEALAIGVDDSTVCFTHTQDESAANFIFKGEYTDTESGEGEHAGSHTVSFNLAHSGASIKLDDYTVYHSGNFRAGQDYVIPSELSEYQPLATAINKENIGNQSVAYAANAGQLGGYQRNNYCWAQSVGPSSDATEIYHADISGGFFPNISKPSGMSGSDAGIITIPTWTNTSSGYYATQILFPLSSLENISVRRVVSGNASGWVKLYHSGNLFSLPANGGNSYTVDGEHPSAFAHIAQANNLLSHAKEFNFVSAAFSGMTWFNYRTASDNTDGNITDYCFGDGKGGSLVNLSTLIEQGSQGASAYSWGNHAGLYLPLDGGSMRGNITLSESATPSISRLILRERLSDASYGSGEADDYIQFRTKASYNNQKMAIGAMWEKELTAQVEARLDYVYIGVSYNSVSNLRIYPSKVTVGANKILHEGNFVAGTNYVAPSTLSDYLHKSNGGTVSGPLTLSEVTISEPYIRLTAPNSSNLGYLIYNGGWDWKVSDAGRVTEYTIRHSGNFREGYDYLAPSALEGYVKKVGDTMTGALTLDYGGSWTNYKGQIVWQNRRQASGQGGRADDFIILKKADGTTNASFGTNGNDDTDNYLYIGYSNNNGVNLRISPDSIKFGSTYSICHTETAHLDNLSSGWIRIAKMTSYRSCNITIYRSYGSKRGEVYSWHICGTAYDRTLNITQTSGDLGAHLIGKIRGRYTDNGTIYIEISTSIEGSATDKTYYITADGSAELITPEQAPSIGSSERVVELDTVQGFNTSSYMNVNGEIVYHHGNANNPTSDWTARNLTLAGSISGTTTIDASGRIHTTAQVVGEAGVAAGGITDPTSSGGGGGGGSVDAIYVNGAARYPTSGVVTLQDYYIKTESDGRYAPKIAYNYENGVLVRLQTKGQSTMYVVSIVGNSYNRNNAPIRSEIQFYDYSQNGGTLLQYSAINYGQAIGDVSVFYYDGYVYVWFKQQGNFYTFEITARTNKSSVNVISELSNSAKPSTITDEQVITPIQSYNSSNFNSTTLDSLGVLMKDSPAGNITTLDINSWNAKQNAISDLQTIRDGAALGATALQSVPSTYRTASAQDSIDNDIKDRLNDIESQESAWNSKYTKLPSGIPSSDLDSEVQTSLRMADSALQTSDISLVTGEVSENTNYTLKLSVRNIETRIGGIRMSGDTPVAPFIRNVVRSTSGTWSASMLSLQVDGTARFSIGAHGQYTVGSNNNGIEYVYIGCQGATGQNIRITSSTLKWGTNDIYHYGNANNESSDWTARNLSTVGNITCGGTVTSSGRIQSSSDVIGITGVAAGGLSDPSTTDIFATIHTATAAPTSSRSGKPGDFLAVSSGSNYTLYVCLGLVAASNYLWREVQLR